MSLAPLISGNSAVTHGLIYLLEECGYDWNQPLEVVADEPMGFVWQVAAGHLVGKAVLTANRCPAYLDDLWEQQPHALIVTPTCYQDIAQQLKRAAQGEHFYQGPPRRHGLTGSEREVLHLYALHGYSDIELAEVLERAPKTVGHQLSSVMIKVGVKRRSQLIHYYYSLRAHRT